MNLDKLAYPETITIAGVEYKNLSVNYVDLQRDLPKGDDRCGKMVERNEAAFELFVADKQFAEAIEPAMADFDHPASGLLRRIAALDVSLLAAIDDMRDVAVRFDGSQVVRAAVSGIGAQVLAATKRGRRALDHDGAEDFIDALAVIDVGPGHDERQRDATAVHQQVALAAFFFPDPSGSGRPLRAPGGPSSWPHRCFAIARRCPPSRRTPPIRLSTVPRKNRPPPTRGSACESRWHCQNVPWARPSTGNPCAARTRSPQTLAVPASAVAQLRACAHTSSWAAPRAAESAALPAARRSPLPPTIQLASPRFRSDAACWAARRGSISIYG